MNLVLVADTPGKGVPGGLSRGSFHGVRTAC